MNERTGEIIPITSKRRDASRFLREAILLIPRFVLLLYRLLRDPRVSRAEKILVGAVLAYVANPLDLIPDFVPPVGQVDDLFAVSLVLMRLIADSGENVIREHWTGSEDLVPWIHKVAGFSKIFLPDRVVRAVSDRFGAW